MSTQRPVRSQGPCALCSLPLALAARGTEVQEIGFILPILQMRKQRLSEVKQLVQSHRAGEWLKPGPALRNGSVPKPILM